MNSSLRGGSSQGGENRPTHGRTIKARIVYRGGTFEWLDLFSVPQGWRVAQVPLGSEAVAFGDWATVRHDNQGTPCIVGIRQGGWVTVRSRTRIPPNADLKKQIEARGWYAVWNDDGLLSVAARSEDAKAAREFVRACESRALLGPASIGGTAAKATS